MNLKNTAGVTRSDRHFIPVSNIVEREGLNCRIDYGDIEELELSIAANGIKEPITVLNNKENDTVTVINGHRRFRAVHNLISKGTIIEKIPCIVLSEINELDIYADQIRRNDGKLFNELEMGISMKRIRDVVFGGKDAVTQREIAKIVGKREQTVSNCLKLADAHPKIQKMISKGSYPVSTVLDVLRKENDPNEQIRILTTTLNNAKASGKDRATGKDVLDTMIKKGTVKRELSQKARLRSLYDENLSGSNAKSVKVIEVVLNFLEKKATEKDILSVLGLSVESPSKKTE